MNLSLARMLNGQQQDDEDRAESQAKRQVRGPDYKELKMASIVDTIKASSIILITRKSYNVRYL